MLNLITKKLLKLLLLALLVLSFLVVSNLFTYHRLIAEKPIAHLTFTPIKHQEYDASLRLGDSCEENIFRIYGDEWQIDSQFLKWKSWATLLGLDAMYRLDRLSGRYSNIDDENSKTHSAHDLRSNSTLDLSKIAKRYNNKFPPVDTVYGSSAYEKMKEDVLYTVSVTQSGIIIREKEQHTSDKMHECVDTKSKFKNVVLMLDDKLATLIRSIY